MNWIIFWMSALACYRFTILFTRDLGPFGIFKWLRNLPTLGKLFKCTYCLSVYTGFLTTIILINAGLFMGWWLSVILSFAFSAVTIVADRTFTADYIT